jgi:hypothetical protein
MREARCGPDEPTERSLGAGRRRVDQDPAAIGRVSGGRAQRIDKFLQRARRQWRTISRLSQRFGVLSIDRSGADKVNDLTISKGLDLPRFRGRLRAWDQGMRFDGILSSCELFFCSAPGGAILPSRPARWCGRRAQRRSRTAPSWGRPKGSSLTAASTAAGSCASGSAGRAWCRRS